MALLVRVDGEVLDHGVGEQLVGDLTGGVEIRFTGEPDLDTAREIADKLLANPVIEDFAIHTDQVDETVSEGA